VCHGDLGPWNFLEKDGRLTGVIDWDLAHFGQSLDDLASTPIEMVPLRMPIEGNMGNDVPRPLLMNHLEKLLDACGEVRAQIGRFSVLCSAN
jgi:aminoglycoside phosphotransferase (APT) family kinase protein